jgi:hypothetical protein
MQKPVNIIITEPAGITRINEPVTMGIPFKKGILNDPSLLSIFDENDKPVPVQVEVLNKWSDGSIKWALFDFQVNIEADKKATWQLKSEKSDVSALKEKAINISESPEEFIVDTGMSIMTIDRRLFIPFKSVMVSDIDLIAKQRCSTLLINTKGEKFEPFIKHSKVETQGPLRTTLYLEGIFCHKKSRGTELIDFFARLHLYAQHSFSKVEFTIRNPKAAEHPGGMWDLGDKGSVFFKDLSINVGIHSGETHIQWKTQFKDPVNKNYSDIEIYQDSSGEENWQSRNHVNYQGRVTTTFKGYRVYNAEKIIKSGERANPVLSVAKENGKIGATINKFWQNFPKALKASDGIVSIKLFPDRFNGLFELQGGEQKTHTIFLMFSKLDGEDIEWTLLPIIPKLTPEYYAYTNVFGYLTPKEKDSHSSYISVMDTIIEGEKSFFNRREIIDEYGWRNFGDLYADHEGLYYDGPQPVISHYNNQYDGICGFLLQYARSGDFRWLELADDLTHHVMDIDIYHTDKDKPAYNGGLFWQTDHYVDAATSTHRTYSRKTIELKKLRDYGGGPANEHNYTTGLLYYYFMTGNPMAKDSVIGLAEWVINMDDGSKSPFRFICKNATGLASQTGSCTYHKPGRGCGNSINALLDAYILTGWKKYKDKVEELICRCIQPEDDIESINPVKDPEYRWSYLVFLQVLGKYLDMKTECGEMDYMFCYARESLLHYAKWMLENEVPYKQLLHVVEYPTESWIVMDMRKSNIFDYASKYTLNEILRQKFLEKASFFYKTCIKDLQDFETRYFMRPLVMLMNYGVMRLYFDNHPEEKVVCKDCNHNYGKPQKFVPQRIVAIKRVKLAGVAICFIFMVIMSLIIIKI